jgi:hypothetical protein
MQRPSFPLTEIAVLLALICSLVAFFAADPGLIVAAVVLGLAAGFRARRGRDVAPMARRR